jgi:hypothetical protein
MQGTIAVRNGVLGALFHLCVSQAHAVGLKDRVWRRTKVSVLKPANTKRQHVKRAPQPKSVGPRAGTIYIMRVFGVSTRALQCSNLSYTGTPCPGCGRQRPARARPDRPYTRICTARTRSCPRTPRAMYRRYVDPVWCCWCESLPRRHRSPGC